MCNATYIYIVSGKEFRALFISTVINMDAVPDIKESHLGFITDENMLNTAMTRVKSHIAVIGNPQTLCTLGKCQKVWIKYLNLCGCYDYGDEMETGSMVTFFFYFLCAVCFYLFFCSNALFCGLNGAVHS